MTKDLKKLFIAIKKDGWEVVHTGKHLKCYAPNGKGIVTVAHTSSDYNIVRVVARDMRRLGYIGYTKYY